MRAALHRPGRFRANATGALAQSGRHGGAAITHFIVTHRLWWTGTTALIGVFVALGALLGARNELFFDDHVRETNTQVEALLAGERLVPPPPLPPAVFATAEVEQVRPFTREGSRDWASLEADFRSRLLLVYKIMKERHGYDMALLEGYRSAERQAQLAALGGNVTQAKAYQSYHQYRLAAHNRFHRDGKLVISERDAWAMAGYRLYGEVAESLGLTWGGRWSFKDYGHVEYRKPGVRMPRD